MVKSLAYLTAVVLVVIAVAVVASASAWRQPIYGPSWGRFTIAFPGPPSSGAPLPANMYQSRSAADGRTTVVYVFAESYPLSTGSFSLAAMKHFVAHRIPGLTVPVHVESAEG
jgi:hypothetical protein